MPSQTLVQDYQLSDADFQLFRELIYRLTGISLSDGKRQLVQSRLQKRLRSLGLSAYSQYYRMVASAQPGDAEMTSFINCVTTNKTDFFREPHHFDFVCTEVLPPLIDAVRYGQRDANLRIWHAGCSSGEEPYTLAMTLSEALAGQGPWNVKQLASDIDSDVLALAERGIYDAARIRTVPNELLRKHFLRKQTADGYLYKVRRELSAQIAFRQINLLEESWPIRSDVRFDMIFCRNVVIYFDKPTQKRLFARFAERLQPGGYLFIGHSESLLGISDDFEPVGLTIYRLNERYSARRHV